MFIYLRFALEVNKFPNLIESKIRIYRRFQIIILARRYSLLIIESDINVFYSLFQVSQLGTLQLQHPKLVESREGFKKKIQSRFFYILFTIFLDYRYTLFFKLYLASQNHSFAPGSGSLLTEKSRIRIKMRKICNIVKKIRSVGAQRLF